MLNLTGKKVIQFLCHYINSDKHQLKSLWKIKLTNLHSGRLQGQGNSPDIKDFIHPW